MENPEFYLDHASSTPVDPEVFEAMKPYFSEVYANPESAHQAGRKAKQALDKARSTAAKTLNCSSTEIVFTSGGTESNNLAILGYCRANLHKGKHIICSNLEHSSVSKPFQHLKKQEGFEITYLKSDQNGFLDPKDLEKAIQKDTIFASTILANNEIGTIQPIKELAEICQEAGIPLHTDACQGAGAVDLDVQKLGVSMMTLNSNKIYGPKGAGLLYKKDGLKISPIIFGGPQEFKLRPGTQNLAAIIGFAKALEIADKNRISTSQKLTKLRDHTIDTLCKKISNCHLNGSQNNRLPNNINLRIKGIDGQDLIFQLDNAGTFSSTGSACNTSTSSPSPSLLAIGLTEDQANSSIRITLGKNNDVEKINYTAGKLIEIVKKLRH